MCYTSMVRYFLTTLLSPPFFVPAHSCLLSQNNSLTLSWLNSIGWLSGKLPCLVQALPYVFRGL